MQTLTVRGVTFGAGMPKICVPIVGETREEVLEQAKAVKALPADLAEWRVDYLNGVSTLSLLTVLNFLSELRSVLGDFPLLFTFRTKREGGEREITLQGYAELYQAVIFSRLVDLVDVELFLGTDLLEHIVKLAHDNDIAVIASSHDFQRTPDKGELVNRLKTMEEHGADLLKVAVMPQSAEDLLMLLAATEEASRTLDHPVVTMSMGGKGVLSRVAGEAFGSAITFGTAGKASAPGQLPAVELSKMLKLLHES